MDRQIRLLFVDDEEKFLASTTKRLALRNIDVHPYHRGEDALVSITDRNFDVALLDLKTSGMGGEELLRRIKRQHPKMEVVILTGHGSIDAAKELTRQGACEYLQKPCELDDLISAISRAYANKIKSLKTDKSPHVDELLSKASTMTPLAMLEELRKIDKETESQ